MPGFFEHGNEPLGSIKYSKFLSNGRTCGFSRRTQLHWVSHLVRPLNIRVRFRSWTVTLLPAFILSLLLLFIISGVGLSSLGTAATSGLPAFVNQEAVLSVANLWIVTLYHSSTGYCSVARKETYFLGQSVRRGAAPNGMLCRHNPTNCIHGVSVSSYL
jgi:hypothetical protein